MNIKKIVFFIIIILIVLTVLQSRSYAIAENFYSAENFIKAGDEYNINEGQLQETSRFLFKLLVSIGIVVVFIVGTIIGIKFMIASAEDKAKVKETLVPFIIGTAVIFGAFTIWSTVINIGQSMVPESSSTIEHDPDTHDKRYVPEKGMFYCYDCGRYVNEFEH